MTATSVLYERMCYEVGLRDSYISVIWENVPSGRTA